MKNDDSLTLCHSCGAELNKEKSAETVYQSAKSSVMYAGFWKRAAAAIIDSFFLFLIGTLLGFIFIMLTGSEKGLESTSNILGIFLGWLYFALMESSERQATLGKKVLGIIVTDNNGQRISFYRASGRHFGKIVSSITLGVGFIMAGFTKKKQALHDIMFDCFVVVKH